MKKAMRKEFGREFKRSLNRFLSIFFIVSLGVAFFAGVRACEPDMRLSADQLYDQSNLMDLHIIGTMGLTDSDVEIIGKIDEIETVEGAYSLEVLAEKEYEQYNLKLISTMDDINQITVKDGRMPEAAGECLADSKMLSMGFALGDKIPIKSGTEDDLFDSISVNEYEIVGFGSTSYYLSLERGSCSIGNGSLDGFLIVPASDFSLEVYTDIYALVKGASELNCYGDAYKDMIDAIIKKIEDQIADSRIEARYEEVIGEAQAELDDARAEWQDGKDEADEKLADAAEQIADADKKIADAKKEVADGTKKLQDGAIEIKEKQVELEDGKTELQEKEIELEDGLVEISENEQKILDAEKELEEKTKEFLEGKEELTEKQAELDDGKKQLDDAKQLLEDGKIDLREGSSQLKSNITKLEAAQVKLAAGWEQYYAGYEQYEFACAYPDLAFPNNTQEERESILEATRLQLEFSRETLEENQAQVDAGWAAISAGEDALDSARRKIEMGEAEWSEQNKEYLKGKKKIDDAWAEIIDAEKKISDAKQEIADGKEEIAKAKVKAEDGRQKILEAHETIADGELKIADALKDIAMGESDLENAYLDIAKGEEDLADAKIKYEDAKKEAEEKLEDARLEIEDAQMKIDDIEKPKWYVLDRNTIQTYVEFAQDADRIGAIGAVFPAIFFLVAALVSLTTMTRMIEEQRTQIGTFKALGYGKFTIASKYILYALLASACGSVFGVIAGQKILPKVIIEAYGILYINLNIILTPINIEYALMATVLAVACTVIATIFASARELMSPPAELMRPVAPKQGKRVFLEYITPLWKRLSFIQKATIRNMFRYKKRFFMTVFGIGGCMALLLVGYGLRDSIFGIGDFQYNDIWTYSSYMTISDKAEDEEILELKEALKTDDKVVLSMEVKQSIIDVQANAATKSVYICVPESPETMKQFVKLRDRTTKKDFQLDHEGAIITEKLAKLLGVSVGDTIYLKDGETKQYETKITAIAENYIYHYIFVTPSLYEKIYGEKVEYNGFYLNMAEMSESEQNAAASEYMNYEAVSAITFIGEMSSKIDDMLDNLGVVVWVLIISAGLLAFVVLYNLNNINITERKRELATIKVLGFFDGEVAQYVYRENILLTVLGTVAGAVMGIILHRFVILTAEVDLLMFVRDIKAASYIYSILLTFGFSLFVNFIMYFALRKIDMVESLKSVE